MSPPSNSRRYDNSRRSEAARQTRRAVVDAARTLFLQDGYVSTSLVAIAERAGVSVQTVYAQFGNRRGVLKEVIDQTVAGDDAPLPINQRRQARRVLEESDPRRKLQLLAAGVADIVQRSYPMDRMMRSAAAVDPDADELLQKGARQRRQGMTEVAEHLAETGHLRGDITLPEAADRLAALIDPELYALTVATRGWSREQYVAWLAELFTASLLDATQPAP